MARWSVWVATALLSVALTPSVFADAKKDVASKTKEAMENYDMMDYAAARKQLNAALAQAKKAKLDKDPVTAKVYISIGVASFADGDADGAKVAFISAVQIDAKIQIDAAYKSPDLQKLLDEARSEAKGGGKTPKPDPVADPIDVGGGDDVDCATVKGLQHTIIDTAPAKASQNIDAYVGGDITPAKVAVFYRAAGATDFSETKLSKKGECKFNGAIPASAMKGELVHYYVAAVDGNDKVIAAKGSAGSPNILELGPAVAAKNDGEDPIDEDPIQGDPSGGSVSGGVLVGGKAPRVMITLAGGTGFGYVTGNTEGGNMVEQCCVGNSYVVLQPELAYMVNRQLSVGLAGRIGFPIGANINAQGAVGHSTIAPAGLLRLRYALSASGEGVRVMGQVGAGVMRNTIQVNTGMPGQDTDIVAQGPLLVGAGVGYIKKLGDTFAFVADLSVLAGIAVVDKIQNATVNSGVGADLSIGFAVGF